MESGIGTMDLSNEEELPVSSVRRTRPARVTMSGDDEPVTPKKRLRVPPKSHTDTNTSVGPGTRRLQRKPRSNLSKSPRSPKSADLESGGSNTGLSNTKTALDEFPNAKIPVVISDGSERSSSEEDLIISPIRRRRKPAELRSRSQEVQPEKHTSVNLQAEVEDLQDSDNAIRRIRTRGPQDTSARSIRQQKLEELRRRRAGIQEESESEDESPSDEEYPSGPEPIHHAMRRGGNLDEYENDFLDDEDDTVGVDLGVAGVPLEFTYHANKKPFEHFKTEIEWMVHNKLNPAFDRRDEIYELAHKKLDDEVQGYAGSKFSSSVWNVEFMTALRNRPDISRIDVPTMLEHKCDACNRSNHPPKHRVTFSGKRYNRETLEAIEDADDSSSNDDETSSSSDDEQDYFLGRYG